jgi:hypothetical protein
MVAVADDNDGENHSKATDSCSSKRGLRIFLFTVRFYSQI